MPSVTMKEFYKDQSIRGKDQIHFAHNGNMKNVKAVLLVPIWTAKEFAKFLILIAINLISKKKFVQYVLEDTN